jgi:hypothetical protein
LDEAAARVEAAAAAGAISRGSRTVHAEEGELRQ